MVELIITGRPPFAASATPWRIVSRPGLSIERHLSVTSRTASTSHFMTAGRSALGTRVPTLMSNAEAPAISCFSAIAWTGFLSLAAIALPISVNIPFILSPMTNMVFPPLFHEFVNDILYCSHCRRMSHDHDVAAGLEKGCRGGNLPEHPSGILITPPRSFFGTGLCFLGAP